MANQKTAYHYSYFTFVLGRYLYNETISDTVYVKVSRYVIHLSSTNRGVCECMIFISIMLTQGSLSHTQDDVIKWKHFPRYWPFVRRIHRSPVKSPHKGQWRGTLMFSLICAWLNGWVNNRETGYLRRHRAHHDVTAIYIAPMMTW